MKGHDRRRPAALIVLAAIALVQWGPSYGSAEVLNIGARAPEIAGTSWINSGPQTSATLGGRVVLVEFWTFG